MYRNLNNDYPRRGASRSRNGKSPNFAPPSTGYSNQSNGYNSPYGYSDGYSMNPNDYYSGYDRNSYIIEGNDYLGDDFNYINNEYYYQNRSRYGNMQYGDNARQYQNTFYPPSSYNSQYDQMLNTMSAGINDGLIDEMTFGGNQAVYPDMSGGRGRGANKGRARNQRNDNMNNRNAVNRRNNMYNVSKSYIEDDDDSIMTLSDFFNLIICVVLALVLARLITSYVAQHTEVDGHSMNFNLKNHDILVIDKISYRFKDPERFDIIIFPVKNGSHYVKRIIGLPGETVKVTSRQGDYTGAEKPSTIYINGQPLNENFGFDNFLKWGTGGEEIKLGPDEYFVMGDNRNDSKDSRVRDEVGNIKRSKIVGKAVFRIYPFSSIGFIDNSINKQIKIDKKYQLGIDENVKVNPKEQDPANANAGAGADGGGNADNDQAANGKDALNNQNGGQGGNGQDIDANNLFGFP